MDAAEAESFDRAGDDLERLRRALDEQQRGQLRLRADLDNLRRRSAQEVDAAQQEGRREALLQLLPVLDTLERALATGSSDPDFYEGVAAIQRLFIDALRRAGAQPVESVGQAFDPQIHEAVATEPAGTGEPGTVAREIRRGYRVGDELIRPAQVVVTTGPERAETWR